jgi:hypothetical protein
MMRGTWRLFFAAWCAGAVTFEAHAQGTIGDFFPVDPTALVQQLIGSNASFTATADISGRSKDETQNFDLPIGYALLGGRLRTEIDLTEFRGLHACDIAQGKLAEVGLDQVIFVLLPDLKLKFLIYPRARAYVETIQNWRERLNQIVDIQKSRVGTLTIDGHPCTRYKVVATNELGDKTAVDVWQASDLADFPVQMEFQIRNTTFKVLFHNVNLARPNLSLFEPPADFDRYASLQALLQAIRGH